MSRALRRGPTRPWGAEKYRTLKRPMPASAEYSYTTLAEASPDSGRAAHRFSICTSTGALYVAPATMVGTGVGVGVGGSVGVGVVVAVGDAVPAMWIGGLPHAAIA